MNAETGRTAKRLPIACELSEGGQRSRREEISRELFSGCKDVRELEDGYEFVFPGGEEWIERLAHFVASERECCRFFAFELLFEPDLGPVSLSGPIRKFLDACAVMQRPMKTRAAGARPGERGAGRDHGG